MAIIYEKKGNIAYITLNRPEALNALNSNDREELGHIWRKYNDDSEALVAIITGAGNKAFSAGMDMKELSNGDGPDQTETFWYPQSNGFLPYELDIRKPIIAAINGFCIGAAFALILGCDIRIASENSSFALPEVKVGMANRGDAPLLAKVLPLSLAMEMVLTGNSISAQEAYRCGLISRLVPLSELLPTAEGIAQAICGNAPLAVRSNKESVWKGIDLPFQYANRLATSLNYAVINSQDYKEGMQAAKEKRKPVYKGK